MSAILFVGDRWRGERRPHLRLCPSLSVERQDLLEQRHGSVDRAALRHRSGSAGCAGLDPTTYLLDQLGHGEVQQFGLGLEEVPNRTHRQSRFAGHAAHRRGPYAVTGNDSPDGFGEERSPFVAIDPNRHSAFLTQLC